MTHEEFEQLCTQHFKSHIKPDSDDSLVMAYRHDDKIQLIVEHMPVYGLMQIISHLVSTLGEPFLVMAAVTEGLERISGVGVECIVGKGDQEAGDELVEMIKAKLGAEDEIEWPSEIGIPPAQ